ncbi:MAG: hypothetical protein AAGI13_01020 [Pseudomonadota bacterium]
MARAAPGSPPWRSAIGVALALGLAVSTFSQKSVAQEITGIDAGIADGTIDIEDERQVEIDTSEPPAASGAFGPGIVWSWRGRLNQRFEVDTNRGLRVNSNGTVYGSRTTVRNTLVARTKRTRLTTSLGVTGIAFAGNEQAEELARIDPRLVVDLRYDGKRYDIRGRIDGSIDSTSFTQEEETGNTDDETQQITVNYDAEIGFRVDKLNTLVLGVDGRVVDFLESADTLNPNRSIRLTAGSLHALSDVTSLRFTGAIRYFEADNNANTRSQTFSFGSALNHNRTSRHRLALNAGVTMVRRQTDANQETFVGAVGGAGFNYRGNSYNAGLNLLQRVEPTAAGELQSFTRLVGSVGFRVAPQQRLSANLAVSRRARFDDDADADVARTVVRFGPRYTFNLTPDTRVNLGYSFRYSTADESAIGHRVFLGISRRLTFSP